MTLAYDTEQERKQHLSAIHSLASRYHVDEEVIQAIYESRLEQLKDSARVNTYLSVLTARYVKDILHEAHMADSEINMPIPTHPSAQQHGA